MWRNKIKLAVCFICSFYSGFSTNLKGSDVESWNFLGTFVVLENDGKELWEHRYPVQKDSFSVPSDWNPGDEFDWDYMRANISSSAWRSSLSDRVVRGETATYRGNILTLYKFEILLKHPLSFSRAKGEFSRIEEIYYTSRKVEVGKLEESLEQIKFYFDVPHEKFRINYENRSEGRLCINRSKIPEDYFTPKLNPFLATHDMDDLNPAPILKGNLGFKIPPIPSYAESKGKLPENFWDVHHENLRKAYADDDFFRWIQIGFRTIEDCFSEPKGGIHRLWSFPLVFNPKIPSLEFEMFPLDAPYNKKALKGAVFALKALIDYWGKNNYEDYRVECVAYWIEVYEVLQNENAKK